MTNENRDILLQLLNRHRELGISSQIDYDKFYMESIISNSVALSDPFPDNIVFDETEKMVDKTTLKQKMVDKWSIKPSLAEKLADIMVFVTDKEEFTTEAIVQHFGFTPTTAKRYLRQLTGFGYIESRGGNRNRRYRMIGV
jgi:hypothetical protein